MTGITFLFLFGSSGGGSAERLAAREGCCRESVPHQAEFAFVSQERKPALVAEMRMQITPFWRLVLTDRMLLIKKIR